MRRIKDAARRRDDGVPNGPAERASRPQSARSIDGRAWSDRLLPMWVRDRAVSVDVTAPATTVPTGATVPFVVTMTNRLPVPVTVPTNSPRPWTWDVDGLPEASQVDSVPSDGGVLQFDRGERKRFRRRWDQRFQVDADRWEPASPGEYTIGAGLSVTNPAERGLYAAVTVHLTD
jgi:hypothetical protein